jgi:GNAT superfamily N-acetyltransferase
MTTRFIDLCDASAALRLRAAEILTESFTAIGIPAWPDLPSARAELEQCCEDSQVLLGILIDGELAGWGGLQSMYDDVTWELHPLVVSMNMQGRGAGSRLLAELEDRARSAGVQNICPGNRRRVPGYQHRGFRSGHRRSGRSYQGYSELTEPPVRLLSETGLFHRRNYAPCQRPGETGYHHVEVSPLNNPFRTTCSDRHFHSTLVTESQVRI